MAAVKAARARIWLSGAISSGGTSARRYVAGWRISAEAGGRALGRRGDIKDNSPSALLNPEILVAS